MIVEDEEIIRRGIRAIVGRLNGDFTVADECENGQAAWESFQVCQPDIVITDIRMRQMDGLQLIEKLRSVDQKVIIVVLSGYSEFSYAQKALQHKVFDYILKPIDMNAFISMLLKIRDLLDKERQGGITERGEKENNQIVKEIKEYVLNHLSEDPSLNAIANRMELTPNYLSLLFKSETGTNFSSFVAEERAKKAKKLLTQSRLKIYEISEACGYSSPKHFALCFKKFAGMTPQQYKNESGS